MSRDAGIRSSGGFFLAGFGCSGAGLEPVAVVAGFEEVAVVGKPVEQGSGHFGPLAFWAVHLEAA